MVIKRVMDFAKPGVSQLRLTDINESIEEAINLSLVALRKSGIQMERELQGDLPRCYADPHLMEQVLLNLVTNAAQAMERVEGEKRVGLRSWAEGNYIYVGVSDSGPGIPGQLRKKVFDPFFTTKHGGVGIGLSLCHRIIADHGGTIDIYTSKWGGAEFRIQIPLEKRSSRK
jgi:C4-dicarboxylate-specific signal transduction histidine kinase